MRLRLPKKDLYFALGTQVGKILAFSYVTPLPSFPKQRLIALVLCDRVIIRLS